VTVKANAGKREVKENLRKVPYLPVPTVATVAVDADAAPIPMPVRPKAVTVESNSSCSSSSNSAAAEPEPETESEAAEEEEPEFEDIVIKDVTYQVDQENKAYDAAGEFAGWVYNSPDGVLFLSQNKPKSVTGGEA
jgi:hypothetical protein